MCWNPMLCARSIKQLLETKLAGKHILLNLWGPVFALGLPKWDASLDDSFWTMWYTQNANAVQKEWLAEVQRKIQAQGVNSYRLVVRFSLYSTFIISPNFSPEVWNVFLADDVLQLISFTFLQRQCCIQALPVVTATRWFSLQKQVFLSFFFPL